ncbi:MAG: hypothetical protein Q9191_003779 [Dirinaria sp. TL-2023a]
MPSKLAEPQYAQALYESIRDGNYPESEDAISATLPTTAIPGVLKLLKQAREDVKADIRENSKDSALDIDGWILQAKQLRSDIEASHQASKQIIEDTVAGDHLQDEIRDASAKVGLLKEEVLFTETLIAVYERIDRIRKRLDEVQDSMLREESDQAIEGLVAAENELRTLTPSPTTRVTSLLRTKLSRLHEDATARMLEYWRSMVYFDSLTASFNIKHQLHERYQWPGKASLVSWTKDIPRQWLNKYQEAALDKVRAALAGGLSEVETVERVETQLLSKKEDLFASADANDNWNAEWSDEEQPSHPQEPNLTKISQPFDEIHGEEDVSAWGLDEDLNDHNRKPVGESAVDDSEDADAWGWGEDDDDEDEEEGQTASAESRQGRIVGPKQQKTNGVGERAHSTEREITLKETYNITSLPKGIFSIIVQALSDAETVVSLSYNGIPISSASTGLLALPRLVLTMYRAGAPPCYSFHVSGNMFLYNDSLWLAGRLEEYVSQNTHASTQLPTDVSALLSFGKRAYGREMESQRTILSDLLDGAQGFSNCTMAPFAQECDLAVSSVIDRLREVYRQWQVVLSHSALLQSIGSLFSTAINKVIVDIEDMSNISEPESQRLAAFCNKLAALEDLFLPQQATEAAKATQTAMPLTAVYTPGWLKFQYLANILESSLVDIKYLWEEGELGLEFEADEVVELIEALFADTEHRRRAIGDIRRAAGS